MNLIDNKEEDFLDKEEIFAEEGEKKEEEKLETKEEEAPQEEVFVPRYDPTSEAYKCCHDALKRQPTLIFFWILALIALLGGVGALYLSKALDFGGTSKAEAITVIPYASVAAIGIIAKIVSLQLQNGFYSSQKSSYLDALPEKPNKLIQEFYILQHCRRCSQYWIFIVFMTISITTGYYCVVVCAILEASGMKGQKIFQMSSSLGFGQHTVPALATLSWMTLPIWAICYGLASTRTDRIIKSIEATYPKEEIIDCALCNHKLEASNKKKKLMAFAVVCSLGFFIYFFFKRFTCTIFERSFEV